MYICIYVSYMGMYADCEISRHIFVWTMQRQFQFGTCGLCGLYVCGIDFSQCLVGDCLDEFIFCLNADVFEFLFHALCMLRLQHAHMHTMHTRAMVHTHIRTRAHIYIHR